MFEPPPGVDVRSLVRPRLWSADFFAELGVELPYSRPVADGLLAALCLDLPATITNLSDEHVEHLGLTERQLWAFALDQIDDGLTAHVEQDGSVGVMLGASFFLASRLLDLERWTGPLGPDGALVAVPYRHMLLWSPLDCANIGQAIGRLHAAASEHFESNEGAISPDVYWWRAGVVQRIDARQEGEQLFLRPPAELEGILDRLAA